MTKDELNNNLLKAAETGNLTELQKWLMFGADVNAKTKYGDTALIYAANWGRTESVEALLKHPKIDVNAKDKYGDTALILAAQNDRTKIVAALLKHPDIDVTIKNSRGDTALGLVHNTSRHKIIHMLRNYLDYR